MDFAATGPPCPAGCRRRAQRVVPAAAQVSHPIRIPDHPCRLAIPLLFLVAVGSGCREQPPPAPTSSPAPEAQLEAGVVEVDRSIRVLLAEGVESCLVAVEGPFRLVDSGTGEVLLAGEAGEWEARFQETSLLVQRFEKSFTPRVIDLVTEENQPITLSWAPPERRAFPGHIRFMRGESATGAVLNIVDMEEYLPGVVAAELLPGFHLEAFRAQAIAARTYAFYQSRTRGRSRDWDVKSTEASQVYLGLDRRDQVPVASEAVASTRGIVCTWAAPEGQRIFCTYYSSTCGGMTQPAGAIKNEPIIAPLAGGVVCEYCRESSAYRWGPVTFSKVVLTQRLRARYPKFESIGKIEDLVVEEMTFGDRPLKLRLSDAQGRNIHLISEDFRLAADPTGRELKSTWFVPRVEQEAIVFTEGRGFGHGLGMCQYGAEGLARLGRTSAEILRFYYPQSQLRRAY